MSAGEHPGIPESLEAWAEAIRAGKHRAIARGISAVEAESPAARELERLIYRESGRASIIGVTGSPGTGKSTLVEKLALEYRRVGARIGVLAVDPTSPYSGGAILGDRIRMAALAADDGAYIRSMATRGRLGGIARATFDAVTILDAAGCGVIFVETVGVGQDEVEIARLADATLVLLAPAMGDDVQAFKAGVMEIADVFVLNKSDHAGAERLFHEVTAMLSLVMEPQRPAIVQTTATTGEGITALREAVEAYLQKSRSGPTWAIRRRERVRVRLLELLRAKIERQTLSLPTGESSALDAEVDAVLARQRDPQSAAEALLAAAGFATAKRPSSV